MSWFSTVHAIAARLFPDLPRRNIRALAGYLGHSTDLLRRSAGHVAATAFIWRALVPLLEADGIRTWRELTVWLGETAPRSRPARRVYPMAAQQRRALPELESLPARPLPPLRVRQSAFDAATYDGVRVLATERQRVRDEGGELALRFGSQRWAAERLATLMRPI